MTNILMKTDRYLKDTYPWTGVSGEVNPCMKLHCKNYDRSKSWELINNTELVVEYRQLLVLKRTV